MSGRQSLTRPETTSSRSGNGASRARAHCDGGSCCPERERCLRERRGRVLPAPRRSQRSWREFVHHIAAAGSQEHRFAAHLPRRSPRALCAEADCGRGRLARVLAEKLTLDEDANDLRAEPGVQQRPLLFDQNLVTLALAHSESVSTRDGEPEWTCLANHLSAVNVDLRNAPELVPVEIDTMPLGLSHLEVEVKATDEGHGRSGVRGSWPGGAGWDSCAGRGSVTGCDALSPKVDMHGRRMLCPTRAYLAHGRSQGRGG